MHIALLALLVGQPTASPGEVRAVVNRFLRAVAPDLVLDRAKFDGVQYPFLDGKQQSVHPYRWVGQAEVTVRWGMPHRGRQITLTRSARRTLGPAATISENSVRAESLRDAKTMGIPDGQVVYSAGFGRRNRRTYTVTVTTVHQGLRASDAGQMTFVFDNRDGRVTSVNYQQWAVEYVKPASVITEQQVRERIQSMPMFQGSPIRTVVRQWSRTPDAQQSRPDRPLRLRQTYFVQIGGDRKDRIAVLDAATGEVLRVSQGGSTVRR